jgi:hypothetical protein
MTAQETVHVRLAPGVLRALQAGPPRGIPLMPHGRSWSSSAGRSARTPGESSNPCMTSSKASAVLGAANTGSSCASTRNNAWSAWSG